MIIYFIKFIKTKQCCNGLIRQEQLKKTSQFHIYSLKSYLPFKNTVKSREHTKYCVNVFTLKL